MLIDVHNRLFSDALSNAMRIQSRKTTMQILECVLIETGDKSIKITATNLDGFACFSVGCEVINEGKAVINSRKLLDIVKRLDEGCFILSVDNGSAEIKQGSYKARMASYDEHDFPIYETEDCELFDISDEEIERVFSDCGFAVSNDPTRLALNGIYIGQKEWCATDGHRLGIVETDLNGNVVIPAELFGLSAHITGSKRIRFSNSKAMITNGKDIVSVRVIDQAFPKYQNILPKSDGNVMHIPEGLVRAVQRVSSTSNGKTSLVVLDYSEGVLSVSARSSEDGSESVETIDASANENFRIGFNAKYLSEILSKLKGEAMAHIHGVTAACIFDTEDQYFLLMPLRIME